VSALATFHAPDGRLAARQLDAIMAVSQAVAKGEALDDTLDRIAETAASLVSAQSAAVILRHDESATGLALAGSYGLSKEYVERLNATRPLSMGKGPSGVAAQTGRPLCIEDVFQSELCAPWRGLAIRQHYRAMMCVPLRLEDDRVIGVLNAYREESGVWTERDVDLASLLADHAAIAIRTANLLDDARRQVDSLALMVRSLRAQSHEHANRLHAIYGLLALGEVDDARRLIAAVEGDHSLYETATARVENATLAGLLVAESAIAHESGIEIVLDRRSRLRELPPGLADLDAVTILGNMLHNAVEAVAPMAPSRRRVSVALLQRRGETVFRVRDWGPGVASDALPRMLERNFTTKPGHSGVGLHLVAGVVNRTGGTIAIEPKRPHGLAVSVTYRS
jgi:GAF domain-containing protein